MCDVFYGILVHVVHEIFNSTFWNEKFVEFFDGVLVHGTFNPNRDANEGVHFPTIAIKYGY